MDGAQPISEDALASSAALRLASESLECPLYLVWSIGPAVAFQTQICLPLVWLTSCIRYKSSSGVLNESLLVLKT